MRQYGMTSIAPTVCTLLGIRAPVQNEGAVIDNIAGEMGRHDRIAVVVIDAFGVTTWRRFKDLTPTFNLLAHGHVAPVRSVLPAKTPVNFATMVTGAPSEAHTIRDRNEDLTLETVFHVCAESSMKTAAAGRAESTVGLLLMKFARYQCLAESNTDGELTRLAIDTIRKESPEYILIQLLEVDDTGHKSGLEGKEIREAAANADRHLGELLPHLAGAGYGLLLLADHGAHQENGKATHDGAVEDDMVVPLVWRSNRFLKEVYNSL